MFLNASKEFVLSFLLIISWFIFAISVYLLYWAIIMPVLGAIPFLFLSLSVYYASTVQENLMIRKRTIRYLCKSRFNYCNVVPLDMLIPAILSCGINLSNSHTFLIYLMEQTTSAYAEY